MQRRPRRFASLLFVLLIGLTAAVGFDRGWFRVSSHEDSNRDEVHLDLTLNRGGFQSDAEKAIEKTKQEASQLSDSLRRGAVDLKGRVHEETAPTHP